MRKNTQTSLEFVVFRAIMNLEKLEMQLDVKTSWLGIILRPPEAWTIYVEPLNKHLQMCLSRLHPAATPPGRLKVTAFSGEAASSCHPASGPFITANFLSEVSH